MFQALGERDLNNVSIRQYSTFLSNFYNGLSINNKNK